MKSFEKWKHMNPSVSWHLGLSFDPLGEGSADPEQRVNISQKTFLFEQPKRCKKNSRLLIFLNQLYRFRATNSSIFRNIFFERIYSFWCTMHRYCCRMVTRPAATSVHRTKSCIYSQKVQTEDWRFCRRKHVEQIQIDQLKRSIKEKFCFILFYALYRCSNDARSHERQIKSKCPLFGIFSYSSPVVLWRYRITSSSFTLSYGTTFWNEKRERNLYLQSKSERQSKGNVISDALATNTGHHTQKIRAIIPEIFPRG